MLAERQWIIDVRPILVYDLNLSDSSGQGQRLLHRLGQTLAHVLLQNKPVDDDLNGVLFVTRELQRRSIGEFNGYPIDTCPRKTFRREVIKQG
ncbi:unannotated protein [freshwater metagenome]|uniref:Unannotated protein n=1 Tax=freshwater metagenome TaxID=449393 RepID=A0A6J7APE0_9ZZZZ